ncbi:hypothetical protein PCASD_12771 [Puccinia coronata f. sp. avenae]|uniref:Uncharacterized protein n=1 Tax=Puccinia coronata f. sp. avenae TaxID=200324 RepID=A0A2N5SZA7_9BASI|nr:hypothetical protein PCASD_12771 [Puccinia coronata f. sp. avenae]
MLHRPRQILHCHGPIGKGTLAMKHCQTSHQRKCAAMLCQPGCEPAQRPPDTTLAQSDVASALNGSLALVDATLGCTDVSPNWLDATAVLLDKNSGLIDATLVVPDASPVLADAILARPTDAISGRPANAISPRPANAILQRPAQSWHAMPLGLKVWF